MNIHEQIEIERQKLRDLLAHIISLPSIEKWKEDQESLRGASINSVFTALDSLSGIDWNEVLNSKTSPLMPVRDHPLDSMEYGLKFLDADIGPLRVVGVLSEFDAGGKHFERITVNFYFQGVWLDLYQKLEVRPVELLEVAGPEFGYRFYGSYERLAQKVLFEALEEAENNPKIGRKKMEIEAAVRQHIEEEI